MNRKGLTKLETIIITLLLGIILFCIISIISKDNKAEILEDPNAIRENAEIVNFIFDVQTESLENSYTYVLKNDDKQIKASIKQMNYSKDEKYEYVFENNKYQELKNFIITNNIAAWNGYNEKDETVQDKQSFKLEIEYDDGKTIKANGYNKFPTNYSKLVSKLDNLFEEQRKEYIFERTSKNINSTEIEKVELVFKESKSNSFFEIILDNKTSTIDSKIYDTEGTFFERMINESETCIVKEENVTTDLSIIHEIVTKYNLQSINGYNKDIKDSNEYFKIIIIYTNDERIQIEGTKKFNNYETIKNELLNETIKIINTI